MKTKTNINVFMHSLQLSALKLSAVNRFDDPARFQLQLNEYSQRALLLAEKNDYIILNRSPDKDYLDYLLNIGIGTQNLLIPENQGESLSDRVLRDKTLLNFLQKLGGKSNNLVLHPYVSTSSEAKIAHIIQATLNAPSPDLSLKINSKIYLLSLLQTLALPTPKYEIANSLTVINIAKKLIDRYEKIIVLGNYSYGGLAIWPIMDEETFNTFQQDVSQCHPKEQFIVEKLYDVISSPNIQYQIEPNAIHALGITEQLLDDKLEYHGNHYPLSTTTQLEKIQQDSYRICEQLQSQGYRGILGMDFIETREGKLFIVDINGRANASSFGLNVIRKLFPDSYQTKYFSILTHINIGKNVTFAELIDKLGKKTLFDKQIGQGILPYNTGCLQWGIFSAIIIANTQQELELGNKVIGNWDTK